MRVPRRLWVACTMLNQRLRLSHRQSRTVLIQLTPGSAAARTQLGVFKRGDLDPPLTDSLMEELTQRGIEELLRGHGLTCMSVLGLSADPTTVTGTRIGGDSGIHIFAGDIIKNPGRTNQVHKVPKSLTVTITSVLGQLAEGHAGGQCVSETVGGCTDSDPIQSEGSDHATMRFLFCA